MNAYKLKSPEGLENYSFYVVRNKPLQEWRVTEYKTGCMVCVCNTRKEAQDALNKKVALEGIEFTIYSITKMQNRINREGRIKA